MAECFVALHEPVKAANHYRRALELDPASWSWPTVWRRRSGRRASTRSFHACSARIEQINPADRYAAYYRALCRPLLGEDCKATIPALQEQIRRHGPDPALMCALGREYLRADLPELARGWLERTLKADAGNEQALLALNRGGAAAWPTRSGP